MASFTEDNNYRRNAGIEVLNGENYYAWKFDMKMLLVGRSGNEDLRTVGTN